jgi:hypothetical protein
MTSFDRFQEEFTQYWNRYLQLDKELMKYRGVPINNDNIEDINRLIIELQDCYAYMYGALSFVNSWTINVATLIKEHSKFMDDIKAAGAMPENPSFLNSNVKDKDAEA